LQEASDDRASALKKLGGRVERRKPSDLNNQRGKSEMNRGRGGRGRKGSKFFTPRKKEKNKGERNP